MNKSVLANESSTLYEQKTFRVSINYPLIRRCNPALQGVIFREELCTYYVDDRF